jgi:hypothetical protein
MPIVIYKCKVCGKTLPDYEMAEICENSHEKITEIAEQKYYDPEYKSYTDLPEFLTCKTSSGKIVTYKFWREE